MCQLRQRPWLPRLLELRSLAPAAACAAALLIGCSQLGGKSAPVEIVDPAGTVYTNGIVLVRVQVAGPAEEDVQLLLDGVASGHRVEPLLWELDSTDLAEGTYSLVARAPWAGQIRTSEPRTLVVDRTAPTRLQANSLPPNESMAVWLRDPVVAVFSEPLDPASVTDGVFTVSDPSGQLDLRLELSDDGRSLLAYHGQVPELPTKVAAELSSALTDRAGNGLIAAETNWNWALLDWLLPGGEEVILGAASSYGSKVSIGAGVGGRLYLARRESVYKEEAGGDDYDVLVSVWDGSSWTQLGGPVEGNDPLLWGDEPFLTVLPDGTPLVALYTWLNDGSVPPSELKVSRWDGSAWLPLGEFELLPDSSADEPSLAVGPDGRPVIAFAQSGLPGKITVQRWSGTEWEAVGEPLGDGASTLAEVAVDNQNRPLLVWLEDGLVQLARWQNDTWTEIGGADSINPSSYATGPHAAALADGAPIVAWRDATDRSASDGRILVSKWDDAAGWQIVGELGFAGGTPASPTVAPAAEGGAYISWSQSGQVYVSHWDGSSMRMLAGPVNDTVGMSGYEPDIVLSDGIPVVAWNENDGVWARSYNGLRE